MMTYAIYYPCLCVFLAGFTSSVVTSLRGNTTTHVVKLAIIAPLDNEKMFSMQRILPAVHLAIDTVCNDNLLPNVILDVNYGDSGCNSTAAPIQAFEFYMEKEVDIFIGPICDYSLAPVARYTPNWNLPVISPGGFAHDFGEDKLVEFTTLTRISATFNTFARSVVGFFHEHNFVKVKVIYDQEAYSEIMTKFCFLAASAIVHYSKEEKLNYAFHIYIPANQNVEYLLKSEVGNEFAVVVLCASQDSVREIMIKAHEMNYDNGEYVFLNIDLFSSKNDSIRPWYRPDDTERNEKARKAYESLMTVTLRKPTSPEYHEFSEEVKRRAKNMYKNFTYGEEEVNSFVGAFHDAVILYALALNETLAANGSITDGRAITDRMWNRTFKGITGNVSIDANGDRNADYSLLDLNPDTDQFEVVANYLGNTQRYEPVPGRQIHWAGGRTSPPPDIPVCGFDNSKCPPDEPFPEYGIVILVLGSILLTVLVAAFFIYRHIKFEAELAEMSWKVRWEDILFGSPLKNKKLEKGPTASRNPSYTSGTSTDTFAATLGNVANRQLYTKTGLYKGTIISVKMITRASITVHKPLLLEIKKIKDLQNDHIVRFVGSCIDPPHQCILTEYCPKGSLQDVLENEHIKLDWMFRYSIMQDIVRGMAYLHSSDIKSHGRLKSTNCVVDSRFVVKITDFGLHYLRDTDNDVDVKDYAFYQSQLWTAPELLRMQHKPDEGTPKGDVYSFAVICQEIVYRLGVFHLPQLDLSPEEIIERVRKGLRPVFRPSLENFDCPRDDLAEVIRKCWAEDPIERPDFQILKSVIRKLNKDGDKGNILDNLLSRMEQYANNLEALVSDRTSDYLEEKRKAEDLLYSMLPKYVAGQLIRGETVTAETFDHVTIYFSDICGFTQMSAESTPMQIVDFLNDLYTAFDSTVENYDVYKVETIGDAYMVVSGMPIENGNLHVREICRMSIALLNRVLKFRIRHRPDDPLMCRMGVHTGSVCAGVVGLKMPRYCLFGDTVNTTSRMESNGLPLKIHISAQTKDALEEFPTFQVEERGIVEMKGKGSVLTYWLLGESSDPNSQSEEMAKSVTNLTTAMKI